MAGGVGSRFWPASRESKPKQFLDILGVGKSLLRLTFERALKVTDADRIFVMTNQTYAGQVAEELPEIQEDQIFLEPSRNNTAPCIALASLKLKKRFGEGICLVAPSDHVIMDTDGFVSQVNRAMDFAAGNDALVTLGIMPVRPDTGYGYIQFDKEEESTGIHSVERFTEKPDFENAEKFVASGDYLWNSGMFIWSVDSVLKAFERHAKSITDILSEGMDSFFTDKESDFVNAHYPSCDSISVDYALMEPSDNVFVLPSEFGWSDLGTWAALYDEKTKDSAGNVIVGDNVLTNRANNNLIYTQQGKLVVVSGVDDLIIIDEDDVLMILPLKEEQTVKELRGRVSSDGMNQFL